MSGYWVLGVLGVAAVLGGVAPGTDGQSNRPPFATSEEIRTPRPYEPGVLSTRNGLSFSADARTLYVSRQVDDLDARGRRRTRIFRYEYSEGRWQGPEPVQFSREFTDYQAVLAPAGDRLYFTSTRPPPGSDEETRQNIWYVDLHGEQWSAARLVGELATTGWDGYAVPVRNGRLYFVSERLGGSGGVDIWMSEPDRASGGFHEPVNIGALNSEHGDSDLFVDPDERYLIFQRYVDATGELDLWISFRAGGRWLDPRRLDEVNTEGRELSPTVSPDGRYFFFSRDGVVQIVDFCVLVTRDERAFLSRRGSEGICHAS